MNSKNLFLNRDKNAIFKKINYCRFVINNEYARKIFRVIYPNNYISFVFELNLLNR